MNDVPFRSGSPVATPVFIKTDNFRYILSNKLTSLSSYSVKDIVDIVYTCGYMKFDWESIFNDASEKDLWVNPAHVAEILEQFPVEKLQEINWIKDPFPAKRFLRL